MWRLLRGLGAGAVEPLGEGGGRGVQRGVVDDGPDEVIEERGHALPVVRHRLRVRRRPRRVASDQQA